MNTSLTHSTLLGHRKPNKRPLIHAASLPTTELSAAAMAHWPICGDVEVITPPQNGTPGRRAHLRVSIGALVYKKTHWVVHFGEKDVPQGVKALDWFLVSQWRLRCIKEACDLLDHRPDLATRYQAIYQ
jgi:hypothetical protein